MKSGVYQIRCLVNGKVYIGMSRDIKNRWIDHKESLRKGKANALLQADWNRYGRDAFVFEVLEATDKNLKGLELSYILKTNSLYGEYGYNVSVPEHVGPLIKAILRFMALEAREFVA